jgi:hypothetical protein
MRMAGKFTITFFRNRRLGAALSPLRATWLWRGTTLDPDHLGGEGGLRTNWSQLGASRARVVAPPNGAGYPHYWSAEAIATPGQPRQSRYETLRRTIEIPR